MSTRQSHRHEYHDGTSGAYRVSVQCVNCGKNNGDYPLKARIDAITNSLFFCKGHIGKHSYQLC